MLAKLLQYNSEQALNRGILSTISAIVHCEGSLFEDGRLDDTAIQHCEGTLRY